MGGDEVEVFSEGALIGRGREGERSECREWSFPRMYIEVNSEEFQEG